ncbi:MAG: SUMF1/EgtB/PvdO family nonheme iron enzyme [Paludibacteraceae bacterium]|nr:SUMF1/EgtB/PvdO family nonheme iron enzyme [Paludibacteraceae bacterium]
MKKIFFALMALCSTMLLVTSCGQPNTPEEPDLKVVTGEAQVLEDTVELFGQLNITSEELAVAEYGFYISTTEFKKLNDGLKKTVTSMDDDHNFSVKISGLEPETKYYYRAYLVTGDEFVVGETLTFETSMFGDRPLTFAVGNVEFTMIFVNGGTFTMGAPDSDTQAFPSEKPAHQVTVSSYYIGETEVTQELWQAIMGTNPSEVSNSTLPVENVSWNDCQEFITKLNEQFSDLFNNRLFRLPTEAEWEYAARGGEKSQGYLYSGSNNIGEVAWYGDDSNNTTHPVKQKKPNELGIYDMTGNVWEICQNFFYPYTDTAETDPQGPTEGHEHGLRGGGYKNDERNSRNANRGGFYPDNNSHDKGLRLVLTKK